MSDKMRNLLVRTLSGAVLTVVVVGAVLWSQWSFGVLLLAILVGGIYLCVRKIADWRIPVSFIATVFVCYLIKDGAEMAIYQVFAGGLMLGAFFMATDYATSPVTVPGRVIMGIGCGLLLFIIRAYANYPEGCSFAILFMNVCTPLIDRFTASHPFGEVKKHG